MRKFLVTWTANGQGGNKPVVFARDFGAARAQIESLYGGMPGFMIISNQEIFENEELPTSTTYSDAFSTDNVGPGISDAKDAASVFGLVLSALVILFGLITLPFGVGILFIIVGILMFKGVYNWGSKA